MNPDVFNIEMRKFLKRVGVTSQREIEKIVQSAIDNGQLTGNEKIKVVMTLTIEKPALTHVIEDEISLE